MSTDARSKEQALPRVDLRSLPEVLEITAVRVQYEKPQIRYIGKERIEYYEAVELSVKTDTELPAAAETPALYISDIEIGDYEIVGKNFYRFFAFNFEDLKEGTLISLGFPDAPDMRIETKFRYEIEGK